MNTDKQKTNTPREEVNPTIWLPSANNFGRLLDSNGIQYAIFGAGSLAVHNVMVRPTIDIDYVVSNYKKTVNLLKTQPGISSTNLKKEKDGILVADFYFKSGVAVQIWDNNLYSLPMTGDAWSHVVSRQIPGYGMINTISMEDLIVSKVGRYTQQISSSKYEAEKNAKDIVASMHTITKPDFKYVIQRLREGARREKLKYAKIHSLDWFFVREAQIYEKMASAFGDDKIGVFVNTVLVDLKSISTEYYLLHNLRRIGSISKFQSDFMLNERSLSILLKRWKFLKTSGDKVILSPKDVQNYLQTLEPETPSEYAKKLVFSGKNSK
jgi:hypothetical protein